MKGFDGVLVSVVAVIATVLLASTVGALTTETVETTKYTYATNINGIYDSEQIPIPTPYSPAGNFNGWASSESNIGVVTGGIEYSTLDRYNGIPVLKSGQTTSRSGDIPILFPLPVPPASSDNLNAYEWIFEYNGETREGAYAANFTEFKEHLLGGTTGQLYDRWRMPTTDIGIGKISGFEVRIYLDDTETLTYSDATPAAIEFGTGTDAVALLDAGGNVYETVQANELIMVYGAGEDAETAWFSGSFTATGSKTQATAFIDTSKGIEISGSSAYWGNGYPTSGITMVWKGSGTTTYTIPLKDILDNGSRGTATLTLTAGGGEVSASWEFGGITSNFNLGMWPAGYIDIDLYSGRMTASGVETMRDFRDYDLAGITQKRGIAKMAYFDKVQATGNGPKFAIDATEVILTASETVMIDPSVTIGDHFPGMADAWRVTYDSIATYGNSMTINGETYTISNGKIINAPYDYNNEIAYEDVDFKGLSISVFGGNTIMTYSNGKTYTQPTTSTTMSFSGIWYFDADLYSITTGPEEIYKYSGGFGMDAAGAMATYIIMVMIGSFIMVKYRNPGIIDWGIVLFSIAAAWVIL